MKKVIGAIILIVAIIASIKSCIAIAADNPNVYIPISIVSVMVGIYCFFRYNKKRQDLRENLVVKIKEGAIEQDLKETAKPEERITEQFEKNKERLLSTEYIGIIRDYVERYGTAENIIEIHKLKDLLLEKRFVFTDMEIKRLMEEMAEQIYSIRMQNIKKLMERSRLEREEFKVNREKLISSDYYILIQNFVRPYDTTESSKEIVNLKDLLSNKGFEFTDEQIERLVSMERIEQEYQYFKNSMLSNNPRELDDYLINFIKSLEYLIDYKRALNYLKQLLNEQKISFLEEALPDRINQLKKQADLEHFEKKLLDGNFSIRRSVIDIMSGYEFESFLRQLFEKMGYKVEQTSLSGDQGADLIISRPGEGAVVQAKRYSGKVSNRAIQEVTAAIKHYKVEKGIVVTTGEFTNSAIELATSNNIELIDREKLKSLIDIYF